MTNNADSALAFAQKEAQSPSQDWYQQCQSFVRQALGFKSGTASTAQDAWNKTPASARDTTTGDVPPPGVPVYWSGGSSGDGHVALSAGGGNVYSTDIEQQGKVTEVPISEISSKWGLTYEGFATQEANKGTLYSGNGSSVLGKIENIGTDVAKWSSPGYIANKISGGAVAGVASDAANAAKDAVSSIFSGFFDWIKGGLLRAGFFLLGIIFIIIFLVKTAQSQQ